MARQQGDPRSRHQCHQCHLSVLERPGDKARTCRGADTVLAGTTGEGSVLNLIFKPSDKGGSGTSQLTGAEEGPLSSARRSGGSSDLERAACYQLGERKTKVRFVCGQLKDALPPAMFLLP